MVRIMDPYGTELVADYTKVIKDFGLEQVAANALSPGDTFTIGGEEVRV